MSKILIVEDDKEINKLLADFLHGNGYETVCADEGKKATLLLKKQDFSLVIMDLMLPWVLSEAMDSVISPANDPSLISKLLDKMT